MSEMRPILAETAARLFKQHCGREVISAAEAGTWPAALWTALTEAGLTLASVAEDKGGSGADLGDVMTILRAAGRHAAPVPLAETLLAAAMLQSAGRDARIAGNVSADEIKRTLADAADEIGFGCDPNSGPVLVAEISSFQLEWVEKFAP